MLVKFVVCSKTLTPELLHEQETFRDLLILPSNENMNDGKTLDYFAAMARLSLDADFIFKADIDAFKKAKEAEYAAVYEKLKK